MTNPNGLQLGDTVAYTDISLNYRGVLVDIGRHPYGADCIVDWRSPYRGKGAECLRNLRKVQE